MMPMPVRWDGEPITTPGLYAGVDIDSYHQQLTDGPSISSSGLRTIFNTSPAHYFVDSYLNPKRPEPKEREPLIFGRGAHHLLLGEAEFSKYFAIRPVELNGKAWNGNRTDCKEWLEGENRTVLLPAQIEAIRGMSAGLAAHPMVRAGILGGLIEHSLVWKDAETGIWLKVRPDAIPTDAADFADLKSSADVTDDAIEQAIGAYGYNVQGALVGMACREVLGVEMSSFSFVFAEKTPPYSVRVKTLKPADLELGERQVRASLRLFARCLETGAWPGPGGEQTDAEYIELKPYHRSRIENRLALMEMENAA